MVYLQLGAFTAFMNAEGMSLFLFISSSFAEIRREVKFLFFLSIFSNNDTKNNAIEFRTYRIAKESKI
jgi:hypothetical protein